MMLLTTVLYATAQTTDDNKNKAVIETADGQLQFNTDDISCIRFEGGKVTIVHPWGNTTFDHTLNSLTFHRPQPNTLRITANAGGFSDGSTTRKSLSSQHIDNEGRLVATWEEGDKVYIYADASSTEVIGMLTPTTYGSTSTPLTGYVNGEGLTDNQLLSFTTKPRPYNLTEQDGTVESIGYFEEDSHVTINGGNATVYLNLDFERPFSIVKFKLKDSSGNDVNATRLTVNDGTSSYTVNPATATNECFVALPEVNNKTLMLSAYGTDGKVYGYKRQGVTFDKGKYYSISLRMPNHAFSVSENDRVYFSKGNLQAKIGSYADDVATATEWKFADCQYDFIGNDAGNNSFAVDSWVDLFSWVGESASHDTYGMLTENDAYNAAYHGNVAGESLKSDWGTAAASGIGSGWRTLSKDEWTYLLENRPLAAEKVGFATVADKHGIVILPDYFIDPRRNGGSEAFRPKATTGYGANIYTADDWTAMESAGAVFLPAGGVRLGTTVNIDAEGISGTEYGGYYSTTSSNDKNSYSLYIIPNYIDAQYNRSRIYGHSVRLVSDDEAAIPVGFSLADSGVGMFVGANGRVYNSAADATKAGTTAQAWIAYKSDTPGESLAIALTNDFDEYKSWDTFVENCPYPTRDPISGGTWRWPSKEDFETILPALKTLPENNNGIIEKGKYMSSTPLNSSHSGNWNLYFKGPDSYILDTSGFGDEHYRGVFAF